jgi:archaeosine synthase beta-subunit
MPENISRISSSEIIAKRPLRNRVDPLRPYAFFIEPEAASTGEIVDVATLFLVNRECPFRCLMCDLWKNTLEESVAPGAIPEQIRWALDQLPPAHTIKLYNSGNFFDRKAIPVEDYEAIANLVRHFERVVVENHPKLTGPECIRFRDLIAPAQLEVALGLETVHPEVLAALNKEMTLGDFELAVKFLHSKHIQTRAFILLNPPYLDSSEGIHWAVESIRYAFDRGVSACAVIATRTGNGIMEELESRGQYTAPTGDALEEVMREGLADGRGRVFVDLWDAERFFACERCRAARMKRLGEMNLSQAWQAPVCCEECGA